MVHGSLSFEYIRMCVIIVQLHVCCELLTYDLLVLQVWRCFGFRLYTRTVQYSTRIRIEQNEFYIQYIASYAMKYSMLGFKNWKTLWLKFKLLQHPPIQLLLPSLSYYYVLFASVNDGLY